MNPASIARNSMARLSSDGAHLIFGFVSGALTARWFQPEGKGAYAALVTLITFFATTSTLGLGDAVVIMHGTGRASTRRLVSTVLVPVAVSSVVAGVLLILVAHYQLADQGPTLGNSVVIAALSVPAVALLHFLSFVLNAEERIILSSVIRSSVHGLTLVGVVVLVVIIELHVTGGILAGAVASGAGLVAAVIALRGSGISFRPSFDLQLLKEALRFGLVIDFAQALVTLAARVDVLFVYSLIGRTQAGYYSVALTMGQLVAFASLALSFALFPRVARLDDLERLPLVARASRVGIATSIVSGLFLLLAIPIITPLAFGSDYIPSVGPALLLLLGAALWAEQNLLARARTATGDTRLQLWSYGVNLATMVSLDLVLIPTMGIMGAALASVIAPAAGLAVCAYAYRRPAQAQGLKTIAFLPTGTDFTFLLDTIRALLKSAVSRER